MLGSGYQTELMADEKANGAETEAEPKKPTCFVVSPIGAAGSPERKHANVTLKFIIEPVLERCGFQKHADGRHALRADTLGEVGIISRQIISQLLNADLVIADLTGRNPNVFYELAIRHGTGKPFVQLMAKGEILPFDVGHQRTIFFDRTDLEDVEDCKVELEKQVKSAMAATGPIETPIGQTLDYEKLRSGGNVEQALARLTDQMATMNQANQVTTWPLKNVWGSISYGPNATWGFVDTSPPPLEQVIKERVQKYLGERGFVATAPASTINEIQAEATSRAAGRDGIASEELDVIIGAIVDHRLINPTRKEP